MTIDYQKGKIYKIECHTTGLIYIGSTTATLKRRLSNHKCSRTPISNQVLENNNYEIILIENYPCQNKTELLTKEGKYQKEINCVNKKIAGQTSEEYNILYKKRKLLLQRNRRNKDKDGFNLKQREYYRKRKQQHKVNL